MEYDYDATPVREIRRPKKHQTQAERWAKTVGNRVRIEYVYKNFRRRGYIDLGRDEDTQKQNLWRYYQSWTKEMSLPTVREQYNLDD